MRDHLDRNGLPRDDAAFGRRQKERTALRAMMLLVGLAICSLCAFLYVMGHPSPRGPGFLRRFRLHPLAIPEYLALLARGLFHPRLLRSGATGHEKGRSLPGDELVPKRTCRKRGPSPSTSLLQRYGPGLSISAVAGQAGTGGPLCTHLPTVRERGHQPLENRPAIPGLA